MQIAFGLGGEDETAKRRIGVQRLEPDLAMAPVAVGGGALRALVLLDRELAPERGVGDAALPYKHELALAAAAAVGSEQTVGAIGDGGLHRSSGDARNKVVGREADGFGHRRPPDLVCCCPYNPVGSEGTGGSLQVIHGRMDVEGTRAGMIDDRGSRGLRRMDLRSDHRLVERVPAGLPRPIVDNDSRVRFGMTSGHLVFLWRSSRPAAGVYCHLQRFAPGNRSGEAALSGRRDRCRSHSTSHKTGTVIPVAASSLWSEYRFENSAQPTKLLGNFAPVRIGAAQGVWTMPRPATIPPPTATGRVPAGDRRGGRRELRREPRPPARP